MNILVIGAGKMGGWMARLLSHEHQTAIMDSNPRKTNKLSGLLRLNDFQDIPEFAPDMIINAVGLTSTLPVFRELLPVVSSQTILADMASVKNGLSHFYQNCGCPFVSVHPMFGPTFAHMEILRGENAIIIEESDPAGKKFFEALFTKLNLNIHLMSFQQHDQSMADSLSVPFILSMLFAGSSVNQQIHPGTTWAKHMQIAKGLFSEDDTLLSEVLMNPPTLNKIEHLQEKLRHLKTAIEKSDNQSILNFIRKTRSNLLSPSG